MIRRLIFLITAFSLMSVSACYGFDLFNTSTWFAPEAEKEIAYDPLVNSPENPYIVAEDRGNNTFYFTLMEGGHGKVCKSISLFIGNHPVLEVSEVIGGSLLFGDTGYLVLCENATGGRNETELANLLDMPENDSIIKPTYFGNGTYFYGLMDGGAGKFGRTIRWAKGAHPELEFRVALALDGLYGTSGYLVIVRNKTRICNCESRV
jgi:hypothetical protein